ncbi:GNAT family N-acetyltransferase [Bacillus sp. 1P06AnD]|uniref:GNAT family N-acetyltransferase n=1 Tax=Bacillus sp. 1P06AnD TaxID=3132208 RepID=UPI0039A1A264
MKAIIARSPEDLRDVYSIRHTVFMEEQQVDVENEKDQYENQSIHFLLRTAEGVAIGAGRMRLVEGKGKAERVCILKHARSLGGGKSIMEAMEAFARENTIPSILLNAQKQAIGFYEKLGYSTISEEFMEAGILHRKMEKKID